jgi:hypothetical protein
VSAGPVLVVFNAEFLTFPRFWSFFAGAFCGLACELFFAGEPFACELFFARDPFACSFCRSLFRRPFGVPPRHLGGVARFVFFPLFNFTFAAMVGQPLAFSDCFLKGRSWCHAGRARS